MSARRVIFFAHREATELASPWIETDHLLLGLFRESSALVSRFLKSSEEIEMMRARIAERWPRRNEAAESGDLPLSTQSQHVLAYAAEESMRLQYRYIGSVHLLLGLVREQQGFAGELLYDCGLPLSKLPRGDRLESAGPRAARPATPRRHSSRSLSANIVRSAFIIMVTLNRSLPSGISKFSTD